MDRGFEGRDGWTGSGFKRRDALTGRRFERRLDAYLKGQPDDRLAAEVRVEHVRRGEGLGLDGGEHGAVAVEQAAVVVLVAFLLLWQTARAASKREDVARVVVLGHGALPRGGLGLEAQPSNLREAVARSVLTLGILPFLDRCGGCQSVASDGQVATEAAAARATVERQQGPRG